MSGRFTITVSATTDTTEEAVFLLSALEDTASRHGELESSSLVDAYLAEPAGSEL